jgi:hypothetical protein
MKHQMPPAISEGFNVVETDRRWSNADLVSKDAFGGLVRVLERLEIVVWEKPTALVVVFADVAISHQQDMIGGIRATSATSLWVQRVPCPISSAVPSSRPNR